MAEYPSLHDRGRAVMGWTSLGPLTRFILYDPGEIVLGMADRDEDR